MSVCRCTASKRCPPCAEADFERLRIQVQSDPEWQREEKGSGRWKKREKAYTERLAPKIRQMREEDESRHAAYAGFHRGADGRKVDAPEGVDDAEVPRGRTSIRLTDERLNPDELMTAKWTCGMCGNLRNSPLLGDDGNYHCSNVGCDEVVHSS